MTTQFGVRPQSSGPLWRKIERVAALRASQRALEQQKALHQRNWKKMRQRGSEARRELKWHRSLAALRDVDRPQRIIDEVARQYGVPVADMLSASKRRYSYFPRMEVCWRLYDETDLSLPRIGKFVGGRDHSTVLNAIHVWMEKHNIVELPPHRVRR